MTISNSVHRTLKEDVKKSKSQLVSLPENVLSPLKDKVVTSSSLKQFMTENEVFQCEGNTAERFEQFQEECLNVMQERFKATTDLPKKVYSAQPVLRTGMSCVARSFENIVNENWDDFVSDFEHIVSDYDETVPFSVFEAFDEFKEYYDENIAGTEIAETFTELIKTLPEWNHDYYCRLTECLDGCLSTVKQCKKEEEGNIKDRVKPDTRRLKKLKDELDVKLGDVEDVVSVVLGFFEKLSLLVKELSTAEAIKFGKIWSKLHNFVQEGEERVTKMLSVPTMLSIVYSKSPDKVDDIMNQLMAIDKQMGGVKLTWKKMNFVTRDPIAEHVEDIKSLLTTLVESLKTTNECLERIETNLSHLHKGKSKSESTIEKVSEKRRKLSSKISRIVHKESKKEKKERKVREKKEKQLSKKNSMQKKEEKDASTANILMRGVEDIGKDLKSIDVMKPIGALKQGIDTIGTEIKDKTILMFTKPRDLFKGGFLGIGGSRNNTAANEAN